MSLDKLEIWVHDHILKNDTIRHFVYGVYQRMLYMVSPKIRFEGDVNRITPDDGYEYLFGYYDKCPWSNDGRYLLALKVKNASAEADSTKAAEIVRVTVETKAVEYLATTHAWNVQQGCMAQWLTDTEILYNDFRDGKYCAIVLNLDTKAERLLDMPVYAMSPDKKTALTLDFSRLHRLRPGYGYANIAEENREEKCPDKTCIWKMDIATGNVTSLLKYTDFANFEPRAEMQGAEHKVNHLMISPDGSRFMVLHRWFQNKVKYTRLVTCNMDGTDMYNLSDDDFVSHCCWKNDQEILSYLNKKDGGKGYYLMTDKSRNYRRMWEELSMDGHPSYSNNGQFVVTDTYPDRRRVQSIYVMNGHVVNRVARVFAPFRFGGDVRCDLHPRWSKDERQICFDGSFDKKRGVYIVNNPFINKEDTMEQEKKQPLISVVIPTHNRAELLERAVKSALNQTYPNVELIVVSDGSEDNTHTVMTKLCERSSRIRYHSYHPGKGGNYARNTGIMMAQGEYVAFLDDDDEWYQDKLQKQYELVASDSDIGLVCTGINSVQEGEDYITRFIPPATYDSSKMIMLCNCVGSTTTVMVKKELLDKVGMFDEKLGALQDYDLWVRLCQITKVGVVREPCVDYWNYQSSDQVSSYTDKYENAVAYLDEKYKDLIASLTDEEKKKRKVYFLLLIAKKAIRNKQAKKAREYTMRAVKVKLTKSVIVTFVASYFPVGIVNRLKAFVRTLRK